MATCTILVDIYKRFETSFTDEEGVISETRWRRTNIYLSGSSYANDLLKTKPAKLKLIKRCSSGVLLIIFYKLYIPAATTHDEDKTSMIHLQRRSQLTE